MDLNTVGRRFRLPHIDLLFVPGKEQRGEQFSVFFVDSSLQEGSNGCEPDKNTVENDMRIPGQ